MEIVSNTANKCLWAIISYAWFPRPFFSAEGKGVPIEKLGMFSIIMDTRSLPIPMSCVTHDGSFVWASAATIVGLWDTYCRGKPCQLPSPAIHGQSIKSTIK